MFIAVNFLQNLLRIHKNKSCGGMKSSSLAVAESKPKCELCLYEASTWKGQKKHWWNMHKEFLILDLKCQKCGHEAASLASCPLEFLLWMQDPRLWLTCEGNHALRLAQSFVLIAKRGFS